ncbi:ComF family protein [Flavobacterium aciduliphilum]|uniref:ComF family protein n=1 Tax=Flavobacterium aciduliphilum TaxID=1101402 RepID=A0A328YIS1_9FLAO|nr:phosphoribosyltransferase family protein [Flavobacterium aciduliphilum]RAR72635.1 ComF family protein [Flavobacterium aciduliphilum]
MIKSIVNLFFPKTCCGCNAYLLHQEIILCGRCRHEIPLTHHHENETNEVVQKFYGRVALEFGAAQFYFHKKGIVQGLIHHLKYKGQQEIGTVLGYWYAEDLKPIVTSKKITCIIPVPLHKRRLRTRGYNQVTTYGKALSEKLEIPYNETLLFRKLYSKTQTKKSLLKRSEVESSLFEVDCNESHHNQHFLLVDDVITTGATLEACAKALLKIPGARVSIVCIALSQ